MGARSLSFAAAVLSVAVAQGTVRAGVVATAYFPMNEANWNGAAPQVVDSTGNGHDGTAVGGANTVADPMFGRVGSFDGSGQYVTVGGAGTITGARSVVAWVYVPSNYQATAKGQPIVSGGSGGTFDNFGITGTGGENNGLPVDRLYIDHSFVYTRASTATVQLGQWNQLAYTYDGGSSITFYLNGHSAGSISGGLYNYALNSFVLAGNTATSSSTTNGSLDGLMSNVGIYGQQLGAADILALYEQFTAVPEPSTLVPALTGVIFAWIARLRIRRRAS